jgi:kynurenine formamidase
MPRADTENGGGVRLVDLSHAIVSGMPQWPGDDQSLRVVRHSEHGPSSCESSRVEFGCHIGTHVDAPRHFLAGAGGVDDLPLDRFAGPAVVVRPVPGVGPGPLPAALLDGIDLEGIGFVLFDTGWSRYWGQPRYYEDWPWLSGELAARLASCGLKGVGLDTPSLDGFNGRRAHDLCAAAGMVNLENLANLGELPTRGFSVLALPLKLAATEASPVRAVALFDR